MRPTYEDDGSDTGYSTPRKRQRLSSPTYDDHFGAPSQEEVDAFDALDRRLSQATVSPPRPSQSLSPNARRRRSLAIAAAIGLAGDEPGASENADTKPNPPITASMSGFRSAASLTKPAAFPGAGKSTGFTSAINLSQDSSALPSSSPDGPPEQDLSTWFESTDIPAGGLMFKSAKDMAMQPPDDNDPHYHDDSDAWLTAAPPPGAILGFQSAKQLKPHPVDDEETLGSQPSQPTASFAGFVSGAAVHAKEKESNEISTARGTSDSAPAFVGFQSGSSLMNAGKGGKKAGWSAPSAEALAKAAERMKQWEAEIEKELEQPPAGDNTGDDAAAALFQSAGSTLPMSTSGRVVLGAVENATASSSSRPLSQPEIPDTPTPIRTDFKRTGPSLGSPLANRKPFKSPLLARAPAPSSSYAASPLNPNRASASSRPSVPFATPVKAGFSSASAVASTSSSAPTKKSLGVTPRRPGVSPVKKAAFTTPFKPGMRPGEAGREQLELSQKIKAPVFVSAATMASGTPARKDKGKGRAVYFDLTHPPDRMTLASSGLRPQSYSREELESFGVNVDTLTQITPSTATYYRFYGRPPDSNLPSTPLPDDHPVEHVVLGPEEAYQELLNRGCRLATQKWVDNHWGLILWKLAGMVALEPDKEADERTRRWCWSEVIRQLLYRYERELNAGVRPPLRLIAAQDKPAGLPLVLCVSGISWPDGSSPDDRTKARPSVEVTDGWYRVRAEVGEPILRAIRRGALRVGMKIGVVGAKLLSPRSEPFELLENPLAGLDADSTFGLQLTGNGCHLAPWHAKLGFQGEPFVATLGSLTEDGGLVPVMDLTIVKTFPLAYIEFFDTDEGKSWSAPMKEPEEAKAQDAWMAKRDIAAQKIRAKMDKLFSDMRTYADKLEIRNGGHFNPREDDSPPDTIDDLLWSLEEACTSASPSESPQAIIARTTREEAGWLARAIREKISKDRENMGDEIEKELQTVCPPRQVRNFRVVVVEDSVTRKRPKQLTAQITIWDVLSAYVSEEGNPGDFRVGERFMVTNLDPNNLGAWMPRADGAQIYLVARRDTRWRKLKKVPIQR